MDASLRLLGWDVVLGVKLPPVWRRNRGPVTFGGSGVSIVSGDGALGLDIFSKVEFVTFFSYKKRGIF